MHSWQSLLVSEHFDVFVMVDRIRPFDTAVNGAIALRANFRVAPAALPAVY
jgi:hypothetical protein